MARIRQWAAVAVFLMPAAGRCAACQLSLVGPVTQAPLTYNPFQAGAATAAVTFTLKNAGSKPCNAAYAFFRLGALQAKATSGAALNYQMLSGSGSATQGQASPPSTLPSGANAPSITVGAKETYTAHATISAGDGQVVGPGTYTDQLTLGLYQSNAGSTYTKAADAPFMVTIGVNSQMTLAVAGGGRNTTLNFGNLVEGATRPVSLLAYANQGFHLVVSSENGGVMRPVDATAKSEGQWFVPYTVSIGTAAAVDLAQQSTVSLWPNATQKTGLNIPVTVKIGSTKAQRAGIYRDVVTITIDPGS